MPKYPSINFELDLDNIPTRTWIQLGECVSKCQIVSQLPMNPSVAKNIQESYLVKGIGAAVAITGNTLTEEEIRLIIQDKLSLPPSKRYLGKEVADMLAIFDETTKKALQNKEAEITVEKMCRLNKSLLTNIPATHKTAPGELRQYNITEGGIDYKDVAELTKAFCDWLNGPYFEMDEDAPVTLSIIKAVVAHLYIVWICPFGDANDRLARLVEYGILVSAGIPLIAAHLLNIHYSATKTEYYKHLEAAGQKQSAALFIPYAVQGLLDSLAEQVRYIFSKNIYPFWESYIFEAFEQEKQYEPTTRRRRNLILDISKEVSPVPKDKVAALSPQTMEAYSIRDPKTLERDLKELEGMGLLEIKDGKCRAKIERVFAFSPIQTE